MKAVLDPPHLEAYTSSDTEHWCKNYHFGLERQDDGYSLEEQNLTSHDPNHGWVNGQQVETPGELAIPRLFSPVCKRLPKDLPEVRAVTKLMIRRQVPRLIPPVVLEPLCMKLPKLESMVYEPWRVYSPYRRPYTIVVRSLPQPPSLTNL